MQGPRPQEVLVLNLDRAGTHIPREPTTLCINDLVLLIYDLGVTGQGHLLLIPRNLGYQVASHAMLHARWSVTY